MANVGNQKIKILRIMEMFLKETDENHTITTTDIIERLEQYDIKAERKSIYSDIAILKDFGMDILKSGSKGEGYYLASREFELAELKLLVDAVSASKFISQKKSRELVSKIETLASNNEGMQLNRQVVVSDRVKTENENILYSIDVIHRCIDNNHKLSFKYSDFNINKKKVLRHDGKRYMVSPAFLLWDNENYYLVAYSEEDAAIRHYRVDKMVSTIEEEILRDGIKERKALKASDYARKTFSMFDGEETSLHLRFPARLINVIIDRFGMSVSMHPDDDPDYVIAVVTVKVSAQFFGWIAGIGEIEILSPDSVVEDYKAHLKKLLSIYN